MFFYASRESYASRDSLESYKTQIANLAIRKSWLLHPARLELVRLSPRNKKSEQKVIRESMMTNLIKLCKQSVGLVDLLRIVR